MTGLSWATSRYLTEARILKLAYARGRPYAPSLIDAPKLPGFALSLTRRRRSASVARGFNFRLEDPE
jgi:hypothetical protein